MRPRARRQSPATGRPGRGAAQWPHAVTRDGTFGRMFKTAARTAGDFSGVLEFDGETSYFYLRAHSPGQVLGAIHVCSGMPDFDEDDVRVLWSGAVPPLQLSTLTGSSRLPRWSDGPAGASVRVR